MPHKLGSEARQPIIVTLGPAVFDGNVSARDAALFLKAFVKGGDVRGE
jgi:hypothetical protein